MRAVLAVAALIVAAIQPPAAAAPVPADPALVARGEYLSRAGDCASCHRTQAAGGPAYAGGYAIASGFGEVFSSNITPSRPFGIGSWSFADFDRALRKGVRPDGGHLYPAMPYTAYQGVSDADMKALYAYFMNGVAPVDVAAPETSLPFPFNMRAIMLGWNMLFRPNGGFVARAGATPEQQRGQYLVETLGHCSACHSPRNVLMAEETDHPLAGGALGGWRAPNITSDPVSGVGGWPQAEIVGFLRDGRVADKGDAAGGMAEAVQHSLRFVTFPDLAAIAAYLRTVPPVRDAGEIRPAFSWTGSHPVALETYEAGGATSSAALAAGGSVDGALLYNGACASCHGVDGNGPADGFYPSLTSSTTVGALRPNNLVMTIISGVTRLGANGQVLMPAFDTFSDKQVAAVVNSVTTRFGNPAVTVTEAAVSQMRAGGPEPLILRALPILYAGAAVLAVIAAAMGVILYRRNRRTQAGFP